MLTADQSGREGESPTLRKTMDYHGKEGFGSWELLDGDREVSGDSQGATRTRKPPPDVARDVLSLLSMPRTPPDRAEPLRRPTSAASRRQDPVTLYMRRRSCKLFQRNT